MSCCSCCSGKAWFFWLAACIGTAAVCLVVFLNDVNSLEGHQFRVIIAGAPASGKGTVCERIVAELDLAHVSTGDLLRAEVAEGTELGLSVKAAMDNGELVDDKLLIPLVRKRLGKMDADGVGFVLDGFPRTAAQAEALWPAGGAAESLPTHILIIDVPDDVAVERVAGRRVDPKTNAVYHIKFNPPPSDDPELLARLIQRDDDTEEKMRRRLQVFHANTDAWLTVLRQHQVPEIHIDGNRRPDAVSADVIKALRNCSGPGTTCTGDAWWQFIIKKLQCGNAVKPFC